VHENLARARDLAERTVRTVRNIMLLLRPSLLDDLGLGPALQWLTEDFRRRTRVSCEYNEEGLQEDLPDAVKTCVFRVVQEALHNCEKHACSTRAQVNIAQEKYMLSVEVDDDGVGCELPAKDAPSATKHFGVIGMRERAASLGGQLIITSSPGNGTKIALRIPLEEHAPIETELIQTETHV
jgi:signal transduction histidine kinase